MGKDKCISRTGETIRGRRHCSFIMNCPFRELRKAHQRCVQTESSRKLAVRLIIVFQSYKSNETGKKKKTTTKPIGKPRNLQTQQSNTRFVGYHHFQQPDKGWGGKACNRHCTRGGSGILVLSASLGTVTVRGHALSTWSALPLASSLWVPRGKLNFNKTLR